MNTVVIVDSDTKLILNYKRMLAPYQEDMTCRFFQYPEEAMGYIREHPPAVLVCELDLPVMSGKEIFDMVEMISPSTVRIAMSQAKEIEETLDIMNKKRIFKLVIKPFFLVEDILNPIRAGLNYYQMQEKEENNQRNIKIELEMLNKRSEELSKKLEEKKQSYTNAYNSAVGIIRGNMLQGKIELTEEERSIINNTFEGLFQEFMRYYMFEARNYIFHANYLKNRFHHPDKECIFLTKNKVEHEIPNEIMQQIAYAVFMTGYVCAETMSKYHAVTLIEEEGNYYVVKLYYQYPSGKKEYLVKNKKVRKIMVRMVEEIVKCLSVHNMKGYVENPYIAKVYFKKEEPDE